MRVLWFNLKTWPAIYATIILLTLAPLISAFSAEAIASALGCTLNEANTNCPMGDVLYSMFVVGWLGIGTLPIGGLALAVAILVHITSILHTKRRLNS